MKRFIETNRWRNPWFYSLNPKHKLLFIWMLENCDAAGVIEPCWPIVSAEIGIKLTEEDLQPLETRIAKLPNGKLFIVGFIDFQYGKLSETCPPHKTIFKLLEKHGIAYPIAYPSNYPNHYPNARVATTLQYKDKEEDISIAIPKTIARDKAKAQNIEEVLTFCNDLSLPQTDGEWFYHKCEGSGWKNGGNPIKDWKATMRSWKAGGFFPSQKNPSQPPTKPKPTEEFFIA